MAAAALMMWQFSRPAKDSSPTPLESGSPTASSGGIEPGGRERLPQSEPAAAEPAALPQNNLSRDALLASVLVRLREWDDHDDSKLRPERIREIDALLKGTNMLEIVQELPSNLMGYAFASPSLREKLMSDPKAALDWMSSHPNVSQSQLLTLLHDWGRENGEEMQQYLVNLPEGEWKQQVLATASNEALSSDPVAAITWATQMNPGAQQTAFLAMAATDWAKRDPNAAVQWVEQVNVPALREQLFGSVAAGAANIDPLQAADFVIQSVPPGEVLDRSIAGIVWTWAMQDPSAAGAWVSRLPEGQTRQTGLLNLMNIWGNRDGAAATAWVEGLPQGSLQTQAAEDLLAALPAETSAP
jgi:hypothetical protein